MRVQILNCLCLTASKFDTCAIPIFGSSFTDMIKTGVICQMVSKPTCMYVETSENDSYLL